MADSNKLFEQILESSPSQSTSLLILSKIREEGRTDEVIIGCLNALNNFPDYIPLRKLLADAYIDKGSLFLAEKELKKIASEINALIPSLKSLAEVYLEQGKKDEASNILKIYLAHYPNDDAARELIENEKPESQRDIIEEDFELEEYVEEDAIPEETPTPTLPLAHDDEWGTSTVEIDALTDTQTMGAQIKTDMAISETDISNLEEDEFSELATPTLAEIYYNQGQIPEAISTYERVLLKDPNDRKSIERLAEIKSSFEQSNTTTPKMDLEEKKTKMISVLEAWLSKIHERSHQE